ncbi:MAG: NAD(+)/NADH kinase [Bacteroidales bacterium]|nr:NAD(+)/NADH kinase [Bacteroidales bacterium]
MKVALYTRTPDSNAGRMRPEFKDSLIKEGINVRDIDHGQPYDGADDVFIALGGDGTFLDAASIVGDKGTPILGVNGGRLGFLSENRPEAVIEALTKREYGIEKRSLLELVSPSGLFQWPFALNEFSVHRRGAAMLGVDVVIDGVTLPTYWADGLLVATSSGSTAYSLSVGGPIVLPESKVLIISPISPHNLNVRPLVVPDTSDIRISFRSREDIITFSADNRNTMIPADSVLSVRMARFSLNRVRLKNTDFIGALTTKLFWGGDIRNGNEL